MLTEPRLPSRDRHDEQRCKPAQRGRLRCVDDLRCTALAMQITDTTTQATFTTSWTIDIPATVGGDTAYVDSLAQPAVLRLPGGAELDVYLARGGRVWQRIHLQ